jgi:hypothetical protein
MKHSAGPVIGVYPPAAPGALLARPPRPPAFPFAEAGFGLTHLGRGAVWLALRAMGLGPGHRLAMPAYHCGSEVEAARLAGVEIDFYRVDESLAVDEDDLARASAAADATYVISHFGFPVPAVLPGTRVVEDVAHGLFSAGPDGPLGSTGETAVFCPRKSLGVPDGGGLLCRPGQLPDRAGRPPTRRVVRSLGALVAGRAALSRREPVRRATARLLAAVSRGDAATERGTVTEEVIGEWDLTVDDLTVAASGPSPLTARLSAGADGGRIRSRRRANYAALAAELGDLCPERFRDLPPGVCPLYFPVAAPDRTEALRGLRRGGVRAIEIWPVPHPLLDRDRHRQLEPLRRNLLALPVHQELEPWHIEVVVSAAKTALTAP